MRPQVKKYDPPVTLPLPKVINLLTDLKEQRDVGTTDSWVGDVAATHFAGGAA